MQFYLTLLDNYVPDPDARAAAFAAIENIPSITRKAEFCMKWMDSIQNLDQIRNPFGFMELQDVQEHTNFFERRVSGYQVAVAGEVAFHDDF